jgi:hypothetical protein
MWNVAVAVIRAGKVSLESYQLISEAFRGHPPVNTAARNCEGNITHCEGNASMLSSGEGLILVGAQVIVKYRAYTKEWCDFNSEHY